MVLKPKREILDWSTFGKVCQDLAEQVIKSGYQPSIVIGVARGGLIPSVGVAYALDIKNVFAVNVQFYTGVNQRLEFPVMLPPLLDAVDIRGATVLVVDDVADTGGTLELVKRFCTVHVKEVRCAVIYEKPASTVKCEYVWKRTDRWIIFPWSPTEDF